ncbi:MAG: valine--tRNA ligase [Clostridiales bacterium]|nr:valine--tRNA ligase [Clostridiales bacterium]
MAKELSKTYDPKSVEDRIYEFWNDNGYFKAERDPDKEPFTIVIPPPNVTGQLHMGHAFDETLQDILIRYKRMCGYSALWVPGTDHAGIATQIKVEETLRKEKGITRHDLGREEFLKIVWAWKEKYGNTIINQLKKIGSSCDWSRLRFTMDEGCSRAVREVFVNLYNKGLIYRGNRIINWCPHCITALSDAEVEYSEQAGHFWHIRYPIKGEKDRYVIIATTRPETMLGDTAVAVNPDDERYSSLVGKKLILPLVGREIPVIADEYVDKDFGTGCVKITPCHDPNDFEVGKRHGLEEILILDEHAKINENGGKYQGLDRYEARKRIVDDLEKEGYLVKVEEHTHNVGTCYRCKTTVEPITSKQWFVKMKPLAGPAIDVVKDGTIKFIPDRFSTNYINWMEGIHDWCISRQLWWGHRIPAYYCDACGETIVSKEEVEVCPKCGNKLRQDPDVLDTWFSSALWPFSTLGWPENTPDYEYFYPTSVLVTGYDIIPFWVARMIFSGVEHTGKAPFSTVLIHGLIRDNLGRKFSKSLGNGIDPLEMVDKYGADALRFTLIMGNSPGNDMRFSEEEITAYRNFANKIWNAARFTMNYLTIDKIELPRELETEDEWILNQYNDTVKSVRENLDKCELGVAAQKLYDFIWDKVCDWYIEFVKPRLFETNTDEKTRLSAQQTLCYVMSNTLALLHPFMPFVTEEIWQSLPHDGEALIIEKYPQYREELRFAESSEAMENVMALITQIRQVRNSMNVPSSKKTKLFIESDNSEVYISCSEFLKRLAGASEILFDSPGEVKTVPVVTADAKAFIPMDELVDIEKEKARLIKEMDRLKGEIARIESKLSNDGFVSKAPQKVVDAERTKKETYEKQLANVEKVFAEL